MQNDKIVHPSERGHSFHLQGDDQVFQVDGFSFAGRFFYHLDFLRAETSAKDCHIYIECTDDSSVPYLLSERIEMWKPVLENISTLPLQEQVQLSTALSDQLRARLSGFLYPFWEQGKVLGATKALKGLSSWPLKTCKEYVDSLDLKNYK
jgi:hypothetical protein